MENITINRLAGIFEKLAAIEDRYSVGKLSDDLLFAVTQLIALVSEDPPNIDEMLATINYVKNDPNYKYLLLDKLDFLIKNTINDLSNSTPPRFDQMPDVYKTFSNEKLDTLLSTDFDQLKRKLIELSSKEKMLKEDDVIGHKRLNEYKEYIKDLMSDKGRAKFYKDEIKFLIKMNNSIDNIKNLINDIFAKANSTVQSFEQPRPTTQQQQKSKPKKRSPSTTTKVYDDDDEDEDIVESVKDIRPQVKREKDEEGNEIVIVPSEPEETESDVVKVIKAIENVQENIGSGLDVEFEFDNYENIKNTLLESLVNVGVLSYDPAIDLGKTKKEILAEFIGLLKQYRDVAKRSLNDVLSMINTRNITKRREALPVPKPSTPEQFQRQLDKRNLIRRRDTEQVSQVQAPSELLKLGAMLENHLANVGKFIAELEKLYFALSGEKKLKALASRWGDIITGEWWITPDGQSEYADQDVGDVGHEMVAANYIIDKELLLDYLKDYWKEQLDSGEIDEQEYKEQIEDLSRYYSDEFTAGHVFFNVFIPEEIGAKVVGSLDKWKYMKADIRLAFAKYEGAIMVINTSFYAWKVTEDTINNIHNFIFEQIGYEEINKNAEIIIEEASTNRRALVDLDQFLMIKYPAELWRISA